MFQGPLDMLLSLVWTYLLQPHVCHRMGQEERFPILTLHED